MIQACVKAGGSPIANFKGLMVRLGVDCGPTRLPLVNPSAEQRGELNRRLETLGCLADSSAGAA
jgi:dihydrodipicolinate synthase/N-acetylneuraminate lyase